MLKKLLMLGFLQLCVSQIYANVEQVQQNLKKQHPQLEILNIQNTDVKGLYSGTLSGQVVYIDEEAKHLISGMVVRISDQKNLTEELLLKTNTVDYKSLPFQDAIKTIKGNGKHQLVIFSDPNCGYCKKLEGNLKQLNDVTIYKFIYPIFAQSIEPAKKVWCSENKEQAWAALIENGQQPSAKSDCMNPIERNIELGKKLNIKGTPGIIFENGLKVSGLVPNNEIEKIWSKFGL